MDRKLFLRLSALAEVPNSGVEIQYTEKALTEIFTVRHPNGMAMRVIFYGTECMSIRPMSGLTPDTMADLKYLIADIEYNLEHAQGV